MAFSSAYLTDTEHRPVWDAETAPEMVVRTTSRTVTIRFAHTRALAER